MSLRCPCLQDEHIGNDSAAVCRKYIAKRIGYTCPRRVNVWQVHGSCFNLTELIKGTRKSAEEKLYPPTKAVCGTGDPEVPVREIVHARVIEFPESA